MLGASALCSSVRTDPVVCGYCSSSNTGNNPSFGSSGAWIHSELSLRTGEEADTQLLENKDLLCHLHQNHRDIGEPPTEHMFHLNRRRDGVKTPPIFDFTANKSNDPFHFLESRRSWRSCSTRSRWIGASALCTSNFSLTTLHQPQNLRK